MEFNFPKFANDKSPAVSFVESLHPKIQSQILKKLELFQKYSNSHLFKSEIIKKIDNELYELILLRDYRFMGTIIGDIFHILIGFRKKGQKTPENIKKVSINKIKELKTILK